LKVSWDFVDCSPFIDGTIKVLVKRGGNAYYQSFNFANARVVGGVGGGWCAQGMKETQQLSFMKASLPLARVKCQRGGGDGRLKPTKGGHPPNTPPCLQPITAVQINGERLTRGTSNWCARRTSRPLTSCVS
jgi:hypothetical protein